MAVDNNYTCFLRQVKKKMQRRKKECLCPHSGAETLEKIQNSKTKTTKPSPEYKKEKTKTKKKSNALNTFSRKYKKKTIRITFHPLISQHDTVRKPANVTAMSYVCLFFNSTNQQCIGMTISSLNFSSVSFWQESAVTYKSS